MFNDTRLIFTELAKDEIIQQLQADCAPHAGGGESLSRSGPSLPDHATLGTLRKIAAAAAGGHVRAGGAGDRERVREQSMIGQGIE